MGWTMGWGGWTKQTHLNVRNGWKADKPFGIFVT